MFIFLYKDQIFKAPYIKDKELHCYSEERYIKQVQFPKQFFVTSSMLVAGFLFVSEC